MASITSTTINSTPRGNGELYVTFQFTLDGGDVVMDGPRFYPEDTDLNASAATAGQRLINGLAAQSAGE
ncbi:MAG: hypothetical protein Q7T25_11960 [Sideroxyarcus sp.]|nr:hypothetical protein [Sideroxyarcus sp.]